MFDRQGSRKYLNDSERRAYLKIARDEPDRAGRAFCLVLLYTGCRISEALNLTVGCADFSERALVFETLKRRRRGLFRAVPIPENLISLLRRMTNGQNASAKVWSFSRSTGYRMVKHCLIKAGIRGGMACPKGLRHGFATACVANNVPLTTVQKWMGHARLETTAIYLNVTGDEERKFARKIWMDQ